MNAQPSSELELLVRKEVSARLMVWKVAVTMLLVAVIGALAYLVVSLRDLAKSVVRVNELVMIYHPAWDTVLDAVDPVRFPGTHHDDVRKGTLVQQWPAHGGPQHIWELRRPYGSRWMGSNTPPRLPPSASATTP